MQDVMVDLETLGQTPGCAIISIGAVAFDPVAGVVGGPDDRFYTAVSRADCARMGLIEDPRTLHWWDGQSEEARKAIASAEAAEAPLVFEALFRLWDFLGRYGGEEKVRVWGNGADFDNAILAAAAEAAGTALGWRFWNNRCYRTLKSLRPGIWLARTGEHHNALDDAVTQAEHACRLMAAVRPVREVG